MKEMKKMFCVVGCLKISQNAKVIDNFLKSSCRIMSTITPDINIFSKGIIKFFTKNNNEEKQFDSVVNVLQNFQNLIRTKNPSFYFNFHVLNVMKNFLLNKVVINNLSQFVFGRPTLPALERVNHTPLCFQPNSSWLFLFQL